jgi:hypothetical protein
MTGLDEPAQFVVELSRAAIEAGADAVVGHGPHLTLGVEIHRGRPIFYSLGNFILQNDTIEVVPAESYGRFGLGAAAAIRETDTYLERRATRIYGRLVADRDDGKIILDAPRLLHYPKPLRTYVFRRAVRELTGNLRDVSAVHLRVLHELALSRRGRVADLPGTIQARRERNRLILCRTAPRTRESAPRPAPSKA